MKRRARPKRLRRVGGSSLPLALGVLVLALAIVFASTRNRQTPSEQIAQPVAVVGDHDFILVPTPNRAIAKGERIGDVPFSNVRFPSETIVDTYLSDVAAFEDAVATTSLPRNLPIPIESVSRDGNSINAVVEGIPEGMRAITIRVDAEAAVEGWARSGNFIDVILIRANKSSGEGLEAQVIAENVRILSAGRSTKQLSTGGTAPEAPRTVTLLTSQEDALRIRAASTLGKLTFALRGQGDQGVTLTRSVTQSKLFGTNRRTTQPTKDKFRGYARGPNGQVYVLNGNSDWLRAEGLEDTPVGSIGFVANTGQAVDAARAQLEEPEASRTELVEEVD